MHKNGAASKTQGARVLNGFDLEPTVRGCSGTLQSGLLQREAMPWYQNPRLVQLIVKSCGMFRIVACNTHRLRYRSGDRASVTIFDMNTAWTVARLALNRFEVLHLTQYRASWFAVACRMTTHTLEIIRLIIPNQGVPCGLMLVVVPVRLCIFMTFETRLDPNIMCLTGR